ncbi:MAG: hypothetical protein WDN45_08150 [Caulobacteraceae bacterium]
MNDRPLSAAQSARTCAFVPVMSERKPPSQTTVGPSPSTRLKASSSPSGRASRPLVSVMAL